MGTLLCACGRTALLAFISAAASCSPAAQDGPAEQGPPPSEERRTLHVAMTDGGQTGMEGGCPWTGAFPTLRFSDADVRALIAERRESTLGHRSSLPMSPESDAPLKNVTVSARILGEPVPARGCTAGLEYAAEVTLAFVEPALDVVFAAKLVALSAELAVVTLKLEPSVLAAMELPGIKTPADISTLTLGFTPRGPRGTMWVRRGEGGGAIVLPSESSCEQPADPELELDRPLYGVRPGDALQSTVQQFLRGGPIAVQWDDGTPTTLSLSLEQEPRVVCGGLDALFDTKQAGYFQAPLRARIKSGDGRVDLVLPAYFVWGVLPEGESDPAGAPGWDASWSLSTEHTLEVNAPRAAGDVRGGELGETGTIHVSLLAGGPADNATARLVLKEWGPNNELRSSRTLATPGSPP